MTPYELACNIIKDGKVQPCKFTPHGDAVNAIALFMGRKPTHEVFITTAQASLFASLLGGEGAVIIHGKTEDDKFGGFVKPIFSPAKQKTYYLLTFCGVVAETVSAPTATPLTLGKKVASADQAHAFAAKLITSAIAKGYAKKDDRAQAGEDYLCVWITKAQAETLVGLLACVPTAMNAQGNIITQACGAFCYWSKVRSNTGAMLLCWMGEVTDMPTPAVQTTPGKLIPLDMDIPF